MNSENHSKPLVSAVIPTHNRAEILERAIQSVLDQTWENIEIVIVDDASEDETPQLLESLSDKHKNLKVIQNSTSKGASASRNIAIKNAEGEYIAGLDDDDIWRPNRIELLMEEFQEGYSAVTSNDRMDFGEKEIVWKKKPIITLHDLLFYNQVGNQVLTKKEYLQKIGGYDESLQSAQDYDLWIRLAHDFGPIKTAPHTLQVVNMNEDRESITTSDSKTDGYIACFQKHRDKMNSEQIKYQKYRIKITEGKHTGWLELFKATPRHLLIKEITRKLFL
ncbi:glycosyltransferase family 2 protein [Rhodohalobacter sp.]|uniref:glycosyltransferase family 2 protein n=1 Tax=Rhodohalobacter sp. TaxID=1974210 RepID=UPI00356B3273